MPGSFLFLRYHLVWSTKDRRPLIAPDWRDRLYAYMGGILTNRGGRLLAIGGTADHVHLAVSLPSNLTLADALNALKANSSRWVHENLPSLEHFAWQQGYSAFTVSKSAESNLLNYIQGQDEHHLQRDFKSELVELLDKHGIAYDERYLWN